MSIKYGSTKRALLKYPTVDLSKVKFIGWGAGQWFNDYYPHIDIPLSYTVCPRKENQGITLHGIKVLAPETLRDENVNEIFILIFSAASNEITNQIAAIGDFMCAPCFQFGVESLDIISDLQSINRNINIPMPKLKYNTDIGFFTQGPITSFTEICLAYNFFKYPFDYHCLVTYKGQDQVLIDRCGRWVHEIVLIDDLPNPGYLNRNRMIRSAKFGAQDIVDKKIKYAVRVRSGCVVKGNIHKFLLESFGEGDLNKGKIGFYMHWSWKNDLFHISDGFMISRSEDMLNLWSIPEDVHTESYWQNFITNTSPSFSESNFTNFHLVTNEHFLWSNYAKFVGFPAENLEDYFLFMVKNLIPLEPLVTTFSLKHMPLFNLDFDNGFSPDINWWRRLSVNFDAEVKKTQVRRDRGCTVGEFWKGKLG